MANRFRLLCIVAISFLTSAALAQGQVMGFGGLGSAGGMTSGSFQSLGTVPALLGQTNVRASVKFRHSSRASDSSEHGRQYINCGYYSADFSSWFSQYFASYDGGTGNAYAYAGGPYPQSEAQQGGNGNQSQSQGGNQGTSGNQGQNQNQGKQGQGKEEAPPPKPQYLTYTPKKKSLQEQAKSGKSAAVDFKSTPNGAQVTVDGYFVGHTPTTVQIPLGKHLVSITKWGYNSWDREIDVTGKKSVSVNPTLGKNW